MHKAKVTRQMAIMLKVACLADRKLLEIVFAPNNDDILDSKDGKTCVYPFVWLRDNCQCSSCFQPDAEARLMLFRDLDPLDSPQTVKVSHKQRSTNVL